MRVLGQVREVRVPAFHLVIDRSRDGIGKGCKVYVRVCRICKGCCPGFEKRPVIEEDLPVFQSYCIVRCRLIVMGIGPGRKYLGDGDMIPANGCDEERERAERCDYRQSVS